MFEQRLRPTWMALLLALATAAPAFAAGPGAGFKLLPDAPIFKSPDHKLLVEQYAKEQQDESLLFQFWTFDAGHRHASLAEPRRGRRSGWLSGRISIQPG